MNVDLESQFDHAMKRGARDDALMALLSYGATLKAYGVKPGQIKKRLQGVTNRALRDMNIKEDDQ